MDVFELRQHLIDDYSKFASRSRKSTPKTSAAASRKKYQSGRYWPDPLIQINPRYKQGRTAAELASSGRLLNKTASCFSLPLYQHQDYAIELARTRPVQPVRPGWSSGITMKAKCCFFSAWARSRNHCKISSTRQHQHRGQT